jgi:hypothetical protein
LFLQSLSVAPGRELQIVIHSAHEPAADAGIAETATPDIARARIKVIVFI